MARKGNTSSEIEVSKVCDVRNLDILLVEDDERVRRTLAEMLVALDHSVTSSSVRSRGIGDDKPA